MKWSDLSQKIYFFPVFFCDKMTFTVWHWPFMCVIWIVRKVSCILNMNFVRELGAETISLECFPHLGGKDESLLTKICHIHL